MIFIYPVKIGSSNLIYLFILLFEERDFPVSLPSYHCLHRAFFFLLLQCLFPLAGMCMKCRMFYQHSYMHVRSYFEIRMMLNLKLQTQNYDDVGPPCTFRNKSTTLHFFLSLGCYYQGCIIRTVNMCLLPRNVHVMYL